MDKPLTQILTRDYLMWVSEKCSFESAQAVQNIEVYKASPTHIEASVYEIPGKPYTVTIDSDTTGTSATATSSCTCHLDQPWCKHSIAVALLFCRKVKNSSKPGLDRDAIFDRFLQEATREELVDVLDGLRHELGLDENNLIVPAVLSVGTPEETSAVIAMSVRTLLTVSGVYNSADKIPEDDHLYEDWQMTIGSFNLLLGDERGARLLPTIEEMIEALYVLADRDEHYTTFLGLTINLHLAYCCMYGIDSRHVVSWLENNIGAIDSRLPVYDFSPYVQCVNHLDLAAAMNRAIEAKNKILDAYLSLIAYDPEPYRALLAERGNWFALANNYGEHGDLDKAREIIAKAQTPNSGVTIAPDELAELIRLSETAEE